MSPDDRLLDLDTRRTIYRHVEENPGLHLRALQRAIGMPLGTLEYHLHQMQKSGLIVVRDEGRYKAFFVKSGDLDRRDKDILYYVRQEIPRRIVMALLLEPGLSHGEITDRLPVSASTCSFHVKKLVEAEIVHAERVGRGKRFRVIDEERTANVIVRYRRSFLDDLVDRFTRAWLDVGRTSAGAASGRRIDALPEVEGAFDDETPEAKERAEDDEGALQTRRGRIAGGFRHALAWLGRLTFPTVTA